MGFCIDVAWKSLNKYKEELCGDKVEIISMEDSDIVILADGMGSGVKANILATLTSKILGTMLENGMAIEDCVETVVKTLPICQVRQIAYATFSILQIFKDGNAYLVEYDNPKCVFIRDNEIVHYQYDERIIEDKTIREYRFQVKLHDCFVLMSDGVIWAGTGTILNFGWTWESMAEYTQGCVSQTTSAARLVSMLSDACNDLYENKPGDDTTVSVISIKQRSIVNILTGPPEHSEDDEKYVRDFMEREGMKIVTGGTSAHITARVLGKKLGTKIECLEPGIPPTSTIEGIDLVTEGIVTLGKTLKILQRFVQEEFDVEFFEELDAPNGASRIAKQIIEQCTDLNFFVGRAVNQADAYKDLGFDLTIRRNIVEKMIEAAEKMGKRVTVRYY